MNGTEITLPQMLDCRERRNMVQDMLIGKYQRTVISYCMNIPGPIKTRAAEKGPGGTRDPGFGIF